MKKTDVRQRTDKGTSVVFMAAGLGRRFGGSKQLAELGPRGQSLMAYTAYDAMKAGYEKMIFILRAGMKEAFMEQLGKGLEQHVQVEVVFQDPTCIPRGTGVPEEREKPLGTGHALYCARNAIEGPFVILNADDYYGPAVLKDLKEALAEGSTMVIPGYPVKNTLSEKGTVSRGILEMDDTGALVSITEKEKIWSEEGNVYGYGGAGKEVLEEDTLVSMNIWGAQKEILNPLEEVLRTFLLKEDRDLMKEEFYLPEAMDALRKILGVPLKIIQAKDAWMGMTYQEDLEGVKERLHQMIRDDLYPESLFGE